MEKLSIVVPYRKREQHLSLFVPHMEKFLNQNVGENWEIVIVNQADEKPFNRAKLLNVGFAESKDCDYFCFHDVDMLPIESDYSICSGPTHMASEAEQFGWKLPYDGYFGGVTMFDKESFEKINGYSNEYWGWGAEDDDVLARCQIMGVSTFRRRGKYQSLNHERNIDQNLYHQNLSKLNFVLNRYSEERIKKEGLTSLSYNKLVEEKIANKCRRIDVLL